jgi:hypothetical protein
MVTGNRTDEKSLSKTVVAAGMVALLSFGDVLGVTHLVAAEARSSTLEVNCGSLILAARGDTARFSCMISNHGAAVAYLLQEPLVLEGPISKDKLYLYHPVDGERAENTLRFDRDPRWGILFHRVVHLEKKSLENFAQLGPGTSVRLTIRWQVPKDGSYPSVGDWIAQVALIFLDQGSLSETQPETSLGPECRVPLLKRLNGSPILSSLELPAIRGESGDRESSDVCLQSLSRAFKHVFSEQFKLRVRP